MALSHSLLPLLVLSMIAPFLKVHSQGDTTTFTYNTFDPSPRDLTYQGDAFVPSGSSSLRLTKIGPSGNPTAFSVGRVVYSPPVSFWRQGLQASFETTVSFFIKSVDNDPADGLAFFIIPVNSPIPNPSTGGSFGLFNLRTGVAPSVFAVEFDIFFGSDNTWDPRHRHIGIDINSRVSRNTTRFDGMVGQEVTARINYVSNTRTITVVASAGSQNASVSHVIDLKTILPQQVQVGISAATGGSVAIHDLLSWYFTSTLVWDGVNADETYINKYA